MESHFFLFCLITRLAAHMVPLFRNSKTFSNFYIQNITLLKILRAWVSFNSTEGAKLFKKRAHLNHKSRNETNSLHLGRTRKRTTTDSIVCYRNLPYKNTNLNRPRHIFEPTR